MQVSKCYTMLHCNIQNFDVCISNYFIHIVMYEIKHPKKFQEWLINNNFSICLEVFM